MSSHNIVKIHRAILSVSNKTGIVELATELTKRGIEIVSTGGTYDTLHRAGIPVTQVSAITGFPEILDGRVKTLHPAIHAGILARRDEPAHTKQLREHHFKPFELVVVNLYPFETTIARPSVTREEAIENIDIGGPTMVRAAAKNYMHTTVVVEPGSYAALINELNANDGGVSETMRAAFALAAFRHTAHYDAAIAAYLGGVFESEQFPSTWSISMRKAQQLRYGENPHQQAALYGGFETYFHKLHGKELSYNNILDIHAAVSLLSEFEKPSAVIIKHNNPCGAGSGDTLLDAYRSAFTTDPKSAYGGIVAVNRPLDEKTAEAINEIFTEVIIAPEINPAILEKLKAKKDRRLLLQLRPIPEEPELEMRSVTGGFLLQESDKHQIAPDQFKVVTKRTPTGEEINAMLFAWRVAAHVRSNAIVYARADRTLGIGAGQMSRVDSSRIAALKAADAGLDLYGCAVASDAFFPFADGLLEAVKVGASAMIQPGGSVRDQEVINAANDHNVAMVFTGVRHFRH